MKTNLSDFADLIAPTGLEAFLAANWEREPLHIRRENKDYYAQLLTRHDVERAITSGGLRFPSIQLAKGGGFFPPEAFTKSVRAGDEVFTGVPQIDRISIAYENGATLALPGFHRAWNPLGELVAAVEKDFDHPVHANVYIAPGNAQGFTPHYDAHEVFVLQIAGRKHWQIARPLTPLPHRTQFVQPPAGARFEPYLELDTTAGDLLYLPRGFVHATSTAGESSIHVTLGITVFTWVELLVEWAQASRNDPAFREALPPGFASRADLRPALADELGRMLASLQQKIGKDAVVDEFARRIQSTRRPGHCAFVSDYVIGQTR